MKKLIYLLVLIPITWACEDEIETPQGCIYNAVVEDFTGLDGCGFLFKLENGEYLEPDMPMMFCGTPPLPEEYYNNPLVDFEYIHGTKVKIGFEYSKNQASICMRGKKAVIKCIEIIEEPEEENPL